MNDGKALAVACDIEREHGDQAIDFLDQKIKTSLEKGDEEEVNVWVRVREMLVQLHAIAFFSSEGNALSGCSTRAQAAELQGRYIRHCSP
jgi:hypothetical protein